MIEGVIYRYKSPSGKYYIGQTTDEKNRHLLFNSNKKKYAGQKINDARKKYGPKNFEYSVLIRVTGDNPEEVKKYLNTLEIGFIRMYDSYNNGYNMCEGGDGCYGCERTAEHRKKISDSLKGRKASEETRKRLSELRKGHKGVVWTEEMKQKMSEKKKGAPGPNKGKHLSEEQKQKISESKKGNKNMLGHKHSEESRKKMSESLKGRTAWNKGLTGLKRTKPISEESRERYRAAAKKRGISEETQRKMRESRIGRHRVYNPDGTYRMVK